MSLLRRNVSFRSRCQSTSPYPCRTCHELLRSRSAYSYPCRARDGRRLPLLKWSRNHKDVSQRLSTHDVLDVLHLLESYHEDDSFHHQRIFRMVFDSVTPCHFVVVFLRMCIVPCRHWLLFRWYEICICLMCLRRDLSRIRLSCSLLLSSYCFLFLFFFCFDFRRHYDNSFFIRIQIGFFDCDFMFNLFS